MTVKEAQVKGELSLIKRDVSDLENAALSVNIRHSKHDNCSAKMVH